MKHACSPASERTVDECLFHWNLVIKAATEGWAKAFAKSILKQSRRRGWQPSAKQLTFMRRMVSDLFVHRADNDDELPLIE